MVSYASKIVDKVVGGFNPNGESSHLHICDNLTVTFFIREKCIGLSNTSHVDSFYNHSVIYTLNTVEQHHSNTKI